MSRLGIQKINRLRRLRLHDSYFLQMVTEYTKLNKKLVGFLLCDLKWSCLARGCYFAV